LPSTFRNKAFQKEKEDVQRRLQKHMDESEIERSQYAGGEDVLECSRSLFAGPHPKKV
jgi:hypothetical protein